MKTWILKYKFWLIAAIAFTAAAGGSAWHFYKKGENAATVRQATAQIKRSKENQKLFKRIEREAPDSDDDVGVADFLLRRTVR